MRAGFALDSNWPTCEPSPMDEDSPNPRWAVCTCNSCSGHLEFDPANAGETVQCPHCGVDTVLLVPPMPDESARPTGGPPPPKSEPITLDAIRSGAWRAVDQPAEPEPNTPAPTEEPNPAEKPLQQPRKQFRTIIATTGNEISGRTIESYIGIVRGVVVRAPNFAQGVFGGLKTIVGGNIESFAKVCEDARREAYTRMLKQAKAMEADAIIAMRYDATEFAPGVTEVLAYGTAVKLVEQNV